MISANIDNAISSGDIAPISSPAGALIASKFFNRSSSSNKLLPDRRRFAATADEGFVVGININDGAQGGFITFALSCNDDKSLRDI